MPSEELDLSSVASSLRLSRDHIWVSASREAVSFPADGNAQCFEVEDQSWWFTHRNLCLTAMVRRHPPAGTIYDVGGGNGCVARALQENGFSVVLVEPGEAGARNARARGLRHVACTTFEAAGFRDDALPAVGLFDVLEHVKDDRGFLQQIQHSLVPGGSFYLTVPAFNALWSHDDVTAGHFRRYRISELQRLVKSVGFELRYATYFFSALPPGILLFRTLPSGFGRFPLSSGRLNQGIHRAGGGSRRGLVDAFWRWERDMLERGECLSLGSSCLLVAKKAG